MAHLEDIQQSQHYSREDLPVKTHTSIQSPAYHLFCALSSYYDLRVVP